MDRRRFLLSVPAFAAAQASFGASGSEAVRVCVAAGDGSARPDICGLITELGLSCDVVALQAGEAADATRYSFLWIACEDYPYQLCLSPRMLSTVNAFLNTGRGVFAEFVVNFPGAPAAPTPQKTGIARLFVREPLDATALPAGTILDEHDSVCLPIEPGQTGIRTVLSFGEVKGVRAVIGEPDPAALWPGLIFGTRGSGRFAVAGTSISEFQRREYAPAAHWERFLRELIVALLSETDRRAVLSRYVPVRCYTEPRRWAPPDSSFTVVVETVPGAKVILAGSGEAHETSPGRYQQTLQTGTTGSRVVSGAISRSAARRDFEARIDILDRREAYRRALERNLRWFERSGVLLRDDGTLGVTEWISGPDINGNRIPYGKGQMFSPLRADCVFQSGLAFWLAGKVQARTDRQSVGENLLGAVLDLQRLRRGDTRYGLWYTRGRSGPPYLDDVAWGTMGCLAAYRYTRRPILLDRGSLSAAASLTAFKAGGKNGLAPAGAEDDPYPHPHDLGQLLSSWLYAYGVTGEKCYLEAALPLIDRMIEKFPSIPRFLISRTEESVRFLLPLALAYAYTQGASYAAELRKQTAYIASHIADCGAIQEHCSNAGTKLSGTDLGLTYDANETISDQLYTTSFAAMNLWIAYKATGDEQNLNAFHRVADYLTRIQAADASRSSIDGGWMRGFDYGLWEYYGSNADESWTAYCLETGWSNAIIDIALALYLLDDGFCEPRPAASFSRVGGGMA
jgi:hypothetical protein